MPTTGYSVKLSVYNGVSPLDIPHAFVAITVPGQAPVTVGYYPVIHTVAAAGIVKNDGAFIVDPVRGPQSHPATFDKTFDISPGQAQAMLSYAAGIANNPGNYGLLGNQCTGFARDVLAAGGIQPTGLGLLAGNAPHPVNLQLAFSATPQDQVQPWRTDASQIPALIRSIYDGISGNPARIQQYIDSQQIPLGQPQTGGYWFGAELDNSQWKNAVGLDGQASALASTLVPITVAGPVSAELSAQQSAVFNVAKDGLARIGNVVSANKDLDGNILVVGEQGVMRLNVDGTAQIASTNTAMVSVTSYANGMKINQTETINLATGTTTLRNFDTSGAITGAVEIVFIGTAKQTQIYGPTNQLQSTTTTQTYDDGTSLTTIRYASGAQTSLSTDTLGGTKQIDLPDPSNPQIQTTTTRNAAGTVTSTSSITALLDENNNPVANTYSLIDRDAAGTITATGERVFNPVTGSYTTQQITSATPENPNGVASATTTDANGVTTPAPDAAVVNGQGTTGLSETALKQVGNAVGVFNSAYNFLQAVQTGMPLPIIAGGITLFNAIDPTALPPQLTGVASAVGAYTSLISLKGAINRGDFSGVVTSGLNTFVAGVSTFAYLAGFSSLAAASTANAFGGLATAANGLSSASFGGISVLSYLNIANDLINGNIAGAIGNAEFDMRLQGTATAQYLNRTEWLNASDGFLVLDKNGNGTLDNAADLFSNSIAKLTLNRFCYQKRSCLRSICMGYRDKKYIKTSSRCLARAFQMGRHMNAAENSASLAKRIGYIQAKISATKYELTSIQNSCGHHQ